MSKLNAQINHAISFETVLATPIQMKQSLAISEQLKQNIQQHRQEIKNILNGDDARFLVIVGPCSIHDPDAVLEYAKRLKKFADQHQHSLKIVMRAYLEKPRSTVGWKGFVYDPSLKNKSDMQQGLILSRKLLIDLAELDLALATEVLNPMLATYFDDLYSWGAIGARTSESQIHREIASRLPYAIGFKNGTDGNVNIALDAIQSAALPHQFFGMNSAGQPAMLASSGNDSLQIILRGSNHGTNYDRHSIHAVVQSCGKRGMNPAIIVDCSHGNSQKNPDLQPEVLATIAEELTSTGVKGVMIESHLVHGKQSIDAEPMQYGCSITDGCLGWEKTAYALEQLASKILRQRQQQAMPQAALV
ncbi:3-deoxy-7-phosphoheptulonate synthase [Acinetobacter puyangensis]|uniref:Phospho-2-dehydro-3-deoxyheptonate aldolase n=1 Tax=Acinetobacter puyangensis TaxID=1096779 RepID=A0A240EA12_9GAMM|nr:3-deoxy-7-phosphoheptulonate synthase [Acinetobacter puyangensis]SNX45544.1 3-deoxy-D-arabinoheptulosonate-7-phosphate synthase [Acinetobacter puyangensis]